MAYSTTKKKRKPAPRVGGFPATRSAERTYMQRFKKPKRRQAGARRPGMDPVSAPVAPPTAASTIPTVETALSGGVGSYDLGADPAVAAAAGLAAKQRAMAQATALAKRKQAALEYGDPSGIAGLDEATAKAARENPFSILKNIDHSFTKGTQELEEGLNAANLFYSGYRGQQLAEAARGYQQTKYDAANAFRGLMTDIDSALAEALMNADMLEAESYMGSDGGYYEPGSDEGSDLALSLAGGARSALGIPARTAPAAKKPSIRLTPAGNYSNAKKKPANKKRNAYAYRPLAGGRPRGGSF